MANSVPVKLAYKLIEPSCGAVESLPPVIFLHGLTGSNKNWCNVPQSIADVSKRKAYAIDARNHGDSEHSQEFSFDLNVDDLFHFMDTIQAPKATLVGHSMGGVTAIRAALSKPERIEMIFVEDMFTKPLTEFLKTVGGFINIWLESVKTVPKDVDPSEAVKHAIDSLYSKIPPDTPYLSPKEKLYEMGLELKQIADGTYDVKFNKEIILKSLNNPDTLMSECKGQYSGPAYFLYGSLSPFLVGKEEDHIKSHFPRAELIEFKDATHNVHGEYPEKYIETILKRLVQ